MVAEESLQQLGNFIMGAVQDASAQQGTFCRSHDAMAASGPGPQELLGLSDQPAFVARSSTAERYPDSLDDFRTPEVHFSRTPRHQPIFGYSLANSRHEISADPLHRYQSQAPQEELWNPSRISGVRFQKPRPDTSFSSPLQPTNYCLERRQSTAGSHAKTIDSGYQSASPADLASIYSSRSTRFPANPLSSPIAGVFSSTPGPPGPGEPIDEQSMMVDPVSGILSQHASEPVYPRRCPWLDCKKKDFLAKTKSEFNKHMARHERPHKCDVSGCTREEGFPNINDLERHQKSKHGLEPAHGETKYWKCMGRGCKRPTKIWSRLDNFRQHLKQHPDDNPDELLALSDQWYKEDKKARASKVQPNPDSMIHSASANTIAPAQMLQNDWQPPNPNSSSGFPKTTRSRHGSMNQSSNQSGLFSLKSPVMGATREQGTLADSDDYTTFQETQSSRHFSSYEIPNPWPFSRPTQAQTVPDPDIPSMMDLAEMSAQPMQASIDEADLHHMGPPAPASDEDGVEFSHTNHPALPTLSVSENDQSSLSRPQQPSALDSVDPYEKLKEMMRGQSNEMGEYGEHMFEKIIAAGIKSLSETKTDSSTSSSASASKDTIPAPSDSSQKLIACPKVPCSCTFKTKSDLTKHLKRHNRPFGCTSQGCFDRFGSKYDWVRHEGSQHAQVECWRCNVKSRRNGSSICARLFWNADVFEEHVRREHSKSEVPQPAKFVQEQRVGQAYMDRFWCGFCDKVLELSLPAELGVKERNDHIHNHFNKGKKICDWIELDGGARKGKPATAHPHYSSPEPDEQEADFLASRRGQKRGLPSSQSYTDRPSKELKQDDAGRPSEYYCSECSYGPVEILLHPCCPQCGVRL